MTPEEHANLAVQKLKAAGFQVAFAHNKVIAEAIKTALADSEAFAQMEQAAFAKVKEADERTRSAETERDIVKATVAGLEHERDTALSPAATFRERLDRLVNAVVEAGQEPREYSKLWIEVGLSKELLKSQVGRNLIDRIAQLESALEEAKSAGKPS